MSIFLKLNIPSWPRWRALSKVLALRERLILLLLVFIFILSSLCIFINYYYKNTVIVPAWGGQYKEALVGYPQYINPLFAETNEVDAALRVLIFSGLMKYNNTGLLEPDITEKYEILDSGKTYIFNIRKNVFWHNGKQLTADDVVFTINAFQNPEYKSPMALNWRGVNIEKIDDFSVKFSLNNAFAPFLENLTVGILPKHIWENIPPSTAQISDYNLSPIGTGPYKFLKIEKDSEKTNIVKKIDLKANENYYLGKPFIDIVTLKFYDSEEDTIKAFKDNEVDGISYLSPQNKDRISSIRETIVRELKIPRYFAIFFNQTKSRALTDKKVRRALAFATNKQQIIDEVLLGQADVVDTPILRGILGIENFTATYDFSLEKAKKELSEWKDSDKDGILDKKFSKIDKEPTKLEITLYTSDWVELVKIANLLKQQWEAVGGIKVNIAVENINNLTQKVIRPREFESLLFGEILYMDPDPFSFWHSSQKKDPGLNLAMYDSPDVDKLLEQARQTMNYNERIKKYDTFQQIITEDLPAIFLFSPHYLYAMSGLIRGVDIKNIASPARRFSNIEKWYIKTQRKTK